MEMFIKKILNKVFPKNQNPPVKKNQLVITSKDIKAIAGEDVLATQLDLARAYMEIGKQTLATKILKHVLENGNSEQKTSAKNLLIKL